MKASSKKRLLVGGLGSVLLVAAVLLAITQSGGANDATRDRGAARGAGATPVATEPATAPEPGETGVNESGLTFGPLPEGTDPTEGAQLPPDLILAENQDGLEGYLRVQDFYNVPVDTPAEDVLDVAARDSRPDLSPEPLPLYASDGVAVIGEFTWPDVETTVITGPVVPPEG